MVKWGFAGVGILLVFIWSIVLGVQLMGTSNDTGAILETDVSRNSGRYVIFAPEPRKHPAGESSAGSEDLTAIVHEVEEDGADEEMPISKEASVAENISAMDRVEDVSGISGEVKEIRKKAVEREKRFLLKEIRFDDSAGRMRLVISADAAIKDVKTFTLENPRRIVLDLQNLESPYRSEQRMNLENMHIASVRHFAHKDRVRIVLDMQKGWKGSYQTEPLDSGLEVVLVPMDIPEI